LHALTALAGDCDAWLQALPTQQAATSLFTQSLSMTAIPQRAIPCVHSSV
jgi:hypothetical protein